MLLVSFIRAYMGDHGKSTKITEFCPKRSSFFSAGRQPYEKKSSIFQFLVGVGVSVQMFMLGPCTLAMLQISGHSTLKTLMTSYTNLNNYLTKTVAIVNNFKGMGVPTSKDCT